VGGYRKGGEREREEIVREERAKVQCNIEGSGEVEMLRQNFG